MRPDDVTAEPPSSSDRSEGGWLLLAEDNQINQKVAVRDPVRAGYRVDTVLNGAAAVQTAAAQPYDAILMDCQMPELNGYEATAAIREREGSERRTRSSRSRPELVGKTGSAAWRRGWTATSPNR